MHLTHFHSVLLNKNTFEMQDATRENKLRLLMIYAAIYPEKFEGDKASKLMKVCFCQYFLFYFFQHNCNLLSPF